MASKAKVSCAFEVMASFFKKISPTRNISYFIVSPIYFWNLYIPRLGRKSFKPRRLRETKLHSCGFPNQSLFLKGHWMIYLYVLAVWGQNSRHYHGFRCEDFVGRIATLAQQCSKNALESAILPRFYSGFLGCIRVCLIASFQRASKQGFMQLRLHQHHSHVAGAGQWLMDLASLSGVLLDTLVN